MNTATTLQNSTTIAIGGFDGMHIGHQELFKNLDDGGVIVVINTGYANLTPDHFRQNHTDKHIHFYDLEDIRHLDGAGFVALLKKDFPKLQKIVVGYDFHFGKDRRYSYENLKTLFDGEVVVVDEVKHNNDSVHSHKIRQKLSIGDVKGANEFLGYNYTICGKKITGQGIGAKELVATINIEAREFLVPKEGVYVTTTRIDNEEHFHPSVSFVGHRVSTDGSFAIESHILDGKIVCEEKAQISFVAYIRENQKFETIEELREAIKKDIAVANKELKRLAL
ncbi:bifunctional riboflavin kinase/FAD synthetase [Sulfurimonas sp.]|uniref:bifunctional riboflavin kinase/FAD synthetase n=1 Tax=Sulfurimonas sp. TaxID=2022749 RepID=UPI003D114931